MSTIVTIFKNIHETATPFHKDINLIFDRIRNGSSKDLIQKIRKEKGKSERNELKKNLPSICFSGTFSKRADNALIQHSGIICLDFDKYPKQKEILEHKEKLSKDAYVHSVFISPSGEGLKVLVKIPADADNHVNYFNALEKYFNSPYFDKTSKNISRVCYESYDVLIFVNENSQVWTKIEEKEYTEVSRTRDLPTIPITDENKIVDILVKWWTKKYPMVEGMRNENVYVLAMAFNDFGVNKSLAKYISEQFASNDFTVTEINRTIESAYSNTLKFGTKYYEDEERINQIKTKLRRGVSKKDIRYQLQESNIDSVTIDSVMTKVDEETAQQNFWTKNDKGAVKIVHILFKNFLEDNGFYKFYPEGSANYVFVKVTHNLVDNVSDGEIKDFVLSYLLELDDISVYNHFADTTRFFRQEFLNLLATIDIFFIEDTIDTAYLYYKNCAVRITKKEVKMLDYLDLGGYVWKDHVINRNYYQCGVADDFDYKRFIENICDNEPERINSMESTIGFLLHSFKSFQSPAVILNDEVISDNPEGGTGKGIFVKGISHMKKVIVIDGKGFSFDRGFPYQTVSVDTQVLCFDDAKKRFEFERLFSVVTDGMTIEKKNQHAIVIPPHKSPKIIITTNYAIRGTGNSFARRKWELELCQHYHGGFSPYDEFGRLIFGGWNDDLWCNFDNYMIGCLQRYLNTGLVKSKFVNLKIRQLSAETSHEFIEWCGLLQDGEENRLLELGTRHYKQDIYIDFIGEYPDYAPKARMTISRTNFNRWLVSYGFYKYGINPEEGRDATGRWIRFRRASELDRQLTID